MAKTGKDEEPAVLWQARRHPGDETPHSRLPGMGAPDV